MTTYYAGSVTTTDTTAARIVEAADCDRSVQVRLVSGSSAYWGYDSAVTNSDGLPGPNTTAPHVFYLPAGKELWVYMLTGGDVRVFTGPLH